MTETRLEYLFNKYYEKTATADEKAEFMSMLGNQENDSAVKDLIDRVLIKTGPEMEVDNGTSESILAAILQADAKQPAVVRSINRFSFARIAAAAVILVLLSVGGYFYFKKDPQEHIAETKNQPAKDVVAPQTTKAMITLANGQTVALDSVTSGTLAMQGDVSVIKNADGEIVYSGNTSEVAYNTLYNPRGSKVVNLTLQDGSKVWLNAESSLKFPTAFAGAERKVEITGEAYFEVAQNKVMPFIVQKNPASTAGRDVSVKVLGTHFNVNSYDDEAELKITLLEGSVQVMNTGSSVILKPGQQARIANTSTEGGGIKVQAVDVNGVMAWQRGIFELSQTDLSAIMRQISRWYDLDIVYEGKPGNEKFGGGISKNVPLSSMLKLLEANGVKFTLEGKTLKVRP